MKNREHDRIRTLLQETLTPIGDSREPDNDLWPELERRMYQQQPAEQIDPRQRRVIPWFDWVLGGGVAMVAVAFPASIPVLLYYL